MMCHNKVQTFCNLKKKQKQKKLNEFILKIKKKKKNTKKKLPKKIKSNIKAQDQNYKLRSNSNNYTKMIK